LAALIVQKFEHLALLVSHINTATMVNAATAQAAFAMQVPPL
jgi:hypothetical protein